MSEEREVVRIAYSVERCIMADSSGKPFGVERLLYRVVNNFIVCDDVSRRLYEYDRGLKWFENRESALKKANKILHGEVKKSKKMSESYKKRYEFLSSLEDFV